MSDRNNFYYADIKDIISDDIIELLNSNLDSEKITVRIPVMNNVRDNIDGIYETHKYYLQELMARRRYVPTNLSALKSADMVL